jgi:hypothetical protein
MAEAMDALLKKLYNRIFDETIAANEEIDPQNKRKPHYQVPIQNADSHAIVTGDCGDTIDIF